MGKATPEGRVKTRFSEKLKQLALRIKVIWKYMPVPAGMGLPTLDYLLCVNGWFVGVEAKADAKKKLSPRQECTAADIQAAGGLFFLVYDDASIDACIGALELLAREPI